MGIRCVAIALGKTAGHGRRLRGKDCQPERTEIRFLKLDAEHGVVEMNAAAKVVTGISNHETTLEFDMNTLLERYLQIFESIDHQF